MHSIAPRQNTDPDRDVSLSFDRVSMRFPDGTEALDDVSLTIGQGEFVSIVGAVGLRQVDPSEDRLGPVSPHGRPGQGRPRPSRLHLPGRNALALAQGPWATSSF